MRLARKLILALLLAIASLLAINGYFRVRREREVFAQDMRRDHHVLGHALASVIASVWDREGKARALELLDDAGRSERLTLRWIDGAPSTAPTDVAGDVGARFTSHFPVHSRGRLLGTIEISEARDDERGYVRDSVFRTASITLQLGAGAAAVIVFVTVMFVGRPILRLRAKMKRIGEGNLSGRLELYQRDEIGELARDLDAMCEQLEEARRRIERETEGRARALAELRHAERLATTGTLASGIAHELGTPLGVVLARARLIEEGELSPKEITSSAGIIAAQVERISAIIRQLLDVARAGRTEDVHAPPVARMPVALRPLLDATAKLVRPLADKQRTSVEVTAGENVDVVGDAALLQQVVLNLVVNALHATAGRPGPVRLSLSQRMATPPADIGRPPGPHACLEVVDSGHGITPEILPRIFEPFFTTKQVGEGTGLGLSVSYGIVHEHGGWMDVVSQPGAGAHFTVYLPLPDAPAAS